MKNLYQIIQISWVVILLLAKMILNNTLKMQLELQHKLQWHAAPVAPATCPSTPGPTVWHCVKLMSKKGKLDANILSPTLWLPLFTVKKSLVLNFDQKFAKNLERHIPIGNMDALMKLAFLELKILRSKTNLMRGSFKFLITLNLKILNIISCIKERGRQIPWRYCLSNNESDRLTYLA